MWSDTLLQAERLHLLRLAVWAAISLVLGVVLWLLARNGRAPLLGHFGAQLATWGALLVAIAGVLGSGVGMRDHAGAVRLDRMTWLVIGLSIGLAIVGASISLLAWSLGRRLGLVGGGLAMMVQGIAVAVLSVALAGAIVR